MSFNQQLRKRSKQLGLTDVEVARRAGISERRYGHYVAGKREPNFAMLRKLCSVLDTDPNFLLSGDMKAAAKAGEEAAKINAVINVLEKPDLELLAEFADTLIRLRSKRKRQRS